MDLKNMMLVPVLALGLLAVGCGNDCVSLCEDSQECADASKERKALDCDKECEDQEKDAETMGCEDELDDLYSCGADQDDVCKPDEKACETEAAAAFACQLKYCTAHQSDAVCKAD